MAGVTGMDDYTNDGAQVPMEEIRVLHFSCGSQIPAIMNATFKIFTPGLVENKEKIHSIEPTTETYGNHARHQLDIYQAKDDAGPILVFFYGGGLVRGDKKLERVAKGLIYHNLGTYFASRGVTTVIPDYRRVNTPDSGEDAVFPSGGEDVSLVLKWLETSSILGGKKRDVFLMGNSAGALHTTTFLLENSFLNQRKGYSDANKGYLQGAREYVGGAQGISLKGAILVAMPAHFEQAANERKDMLKAYYGSEDKAAEQCPTGLLRKLSNSKAPLQDVGLPKVLALLGEFDPPDEIGTPMEDFVALWKETWSSGIDFEIMKGHNHISPPLALMSGDDKGEEWAENVLQWMLGHTVKASHDAETIKRGPHPPKHGDEKAEGEKEEPEEKKDPKTDTSTEAAAEGEEKKDPTKDTSTETAADVEEKE